ncbi:MAG: hypothetical protein RI983_1121 [Bacteroidota bacterium]|jgi:hypothetical protein
MKRSHKFLHSGYFFPNWNIESLFIGTFNPDCGRPVDYYYRRSSNGFWKILKHYDMHNKYDFNDFEDIKKFMLQMKFGCVDIISSIEFPDIDNDKICGKGFTDNVLFTVKGYRREYNFENIKSFLLNHKVKRVFSTWGHRSGPIEFNSLLLDFSNFCSLNSIQFVQLMSCSGRVYRGKKMEIINNNWWGNLDTTLLKG